MPIERQGANLFFQLISLRYERGPMILTSNQSFGGHGRKCQREPPGVQGDERAAGDEGGHGEDEAETRSVTDKIERFGNLERERVIKAIQAHYGVTLHQVGQRPKWRRDETGRNWWVLGGREDWHGIPAEMMDDEIAASTEGMLVIAQKKVDSIDAFAGTLGPLVDARGEFYRVGNTAGNDQYQFTVEIRRGRMQCVQAPTVLKRFATFAYSALDRERDRNWHALMKDVAAMSDEERARLIEKLKRMGVTAGRGG